MAMLLASCAVIDAPSPERSGRDQVFFGPRPIKSEVLLGAETTLPEPRSQTGSAHARTKADAPGIAGATSANLPPASQDLPKVFMGTGNLIKTQPTPKPDTKEAEEVSLNFEGVDIRAVIEQIFTQYLREPYLVSPSLTGTITLRTTRGIPRKELIPTLEMLLRQNGHALVKEDGLFKIVPFNQVRGSLSPQLGGVTTPLPQGFSVVVVPLKYIGAKPMQQLLEPFTTDASAVRADELRNLVILGGGQRELRHLLDTIDLFDVDFLAGMSVGLFPIKSANVKELVADVDKVFGSSTSPLTGIVRVVPIERLNALLIVTTQPRYLEEAKKWIERLDQASPRGGGLHVYQVKNGKAENLAALLSEIFGGNRGASASSAPQLAPGARPVEIRSPQAAASSSSAAPGAATPASAFQGDGVLVSKDVRVVADKDNNALLIIASQADYEKIELALKQLDVVRRQVLVEVLIAEVRLSDELRFGIEWFVNARNNTVGALRFPGSSSLTSVLPRTPGVGTNANNLPNDPRATVSTTAGLQLINMVGGDIRGILQALGSDGRAQLLSTPQIMALDNEKAQIKVGERISVQTGTQTTGTTTGTITTEQYLDTGVLLTVTPRINASGQVTMEINQEVSEIGESRQGSNNPNIINRNFQTSATVASGDTMVLAGLMRKNRRISAAGLPLLSKIPIVGAAFGLQNYAEDRTELVILITPRVVSTQAQAREVTNELRQKMPMLEKAFPSPPSTSDTQRGK
ncbi:MAG: type II secretion system secretin GspD [Betaproteobacteria bacterium]|nr:type II secretion system secretin GspD [Betaproteobacteria bacterium]